MIRFLRKLLISCGLILLCLFFLWALAALYLDAVAWAPIPVFVACLAAGIYSKSIKNTSFILSIVCVMVLAWWLTLSPDNNRDWRPEVSRLPGATFEGARVTVTNVRNFEYQKTVLSKTGKRVVSTSTSSSALTCF